MFCPWSIALHCNSSFCIGQTEIQHPSILTVFIFSQLIGNGLLTLARLMGSKNHFSKINADVFGIQVLAHSWMLQTRQTSGFIEVPTPADDLLTK